MSTTQNQRIAIRGAREALAEMPALRVNEEPFYWIGRLAASLEMLLDAVEPPETDAGAARQPEPLTYDGPVGDWAPQGQPPVCWQCGATQAAAPLVESPEGGDWQCSNRQMCAGRQAQRAAARDADAAKARCGSPATCAEFGHEHPHIDDATAKAGA